MSEWKNRINNISINDCYRYGLRTVDDIINSIKEIRLKRQLKKLKKKK